MPLSTLAAAFDAAAAAAGSSRLLTAGGALLELLLYWAACLAVQLVLSQPLLLPPLRLLVRLRDSARALQQRARLVALQLARRAGVPVDKRVPADAAAV
eukprot:4840544-Prymnesium_polylepis.1